MTARPTDWPVGMPYAGALEQALTLLNVEPAQAEALCARPATFPPHLHRSAALIAADAALRQGAPDRAAAHLNTLPGSLSRSDPLTARIYRVRAQVALSQGRADDAFGQLEQALAGARDHGDDATVIEASNLIAQILHGRGQSHDALKVLGDTRNLATERGDAGGIIRTHCNQAQVLLALGRTPEAVDAMQLALGQLEYSSAPLASNLHVQSTLGLIQEHVGRHEEAQQHFAVARDAAEQIGNKAAAATMALNAGEMARHMEHYGRAEVLLSHAISAARPLGLNRVLCGALCSLGAVFSALNRFEEADDLLSEAVDLAAKLESVDATLDALLGRGRNRLRQGHRRAAAQYLHSALQLGRDHQRSQVMLDAHLLLADVHEHKRPRVAVRHLQGARVLEHELRSQALREQALTLTHEARVSSALVEASHQRQLREVSETARQQAEKTVHEQVRALERGRLYDPLTNLPNRALLGGLLDQAVQARSAATVVIVDLDGFSRVNDAFGHAAGDDVLRETARRLQTVVLGRDTIARLSSDEFAVILMGDMQPAETMRRLRWLQSAFDQEFSVGGTQLVIRASLGAAAYPLHGDDADTLMRAAHAAMMDAKESGGPVMFAGGQPDRVATLSVESALSRALSRHEFELHYQPLVRSVSGAVVGAEALLRWHHPGLGRRSPAEFIPMLERSGDITAVGEWVLREACQAATRWEGTRVAVNLSARHFMQPDLTRRVSRILYDSGLAGDRLELEITESLMVQSPERAAALLRDLRGSGVRVMLDDFGTGFSNLSYLHLLPIDGVKLDRSFVVGLDAPERGGAIIGAVAAMTAALGLDLVVEGVETEAQRAMLVQLGVPVLQGYLFGRPAPKWSPTA